MGPLLDCALRLGPVEMTDPQPHSPARGGSAPWQSSVHQHGPVRNDHAPAPPEPDTESHPHRTIPTSPLLLTK
jgi:hypothetical protein